MRTTVFLLGAALLWGCGEKQIEVLVALDKSEATSDGSDRIEVVTTVVDSDGAPVARKRVSLTITGSENQLSDTACISDAVGSCAFTVTSTKAETKRLSVSLDQGDPIARTLIFRAPVMDPALSTVTVTPTVLPADGFSAAKVTVTLISATGGRVRDVEVTLLFGGVARPSPASATTDVFGVAVFTLVSNRATTGLVIALAAETTLPSQPTVTFEGLEYPIGGTASGVTTDGVVLQCPGLDDLPVPANATTFTFAGGLTTNSPYAVTLKSTPPELHCTIGNGSGFVFVNVSDVTLTCVPRWTRIVSGAGHTLGLKSDGTLWAWGDNSVGQLGDGTTTSRHEPGQIAGQYLDVSASGDTSMAIATDGVLRAWGGNEAHRIASDARAMSATPLTLPGTWKSIALGTHHVLGIQHDGSLWCWGDNSSGVCGDGTLDDHDAPTQSQPGPYARVFASDDSFALDANGALFAFGPNVTGSLGLGHTNPQLVPARVDGTYRTIATGTASTLALTTEGALWAWGPNTHGAVGVGSTSAVTSPRAIAGTYRSIAAGRNASLVVTQAGVLQVAGSNADLLLGNRSAVDVSTFEPVTTAPLSEIFSSSRVSWAIGETGALLAWGSDARIAALARSASPAIIPGIWGNVFAGPHSSFTQQRGLATLWAWGANTEGQLGLGDQARHPTPTVSTTSATQLVVGPRHAVSRFAATTNSWGANEVGQLGVSDAGSRSSPIAITFDGGFRTLAAGDDFTLALSADASVFAWGLNDEGQLGLGTTDTARQPTRINDGPFIAIAAGAKHALALKSDGSLWSWGSNTAGQLGLGDHARRLVPTRVGGRYVSVSAGSDVSFALDDAGMGVGFGSNDDGQLGLGDRSERPAPAALLRRFSKIVVGGRHVLALSGDSLFSWGANDAGQLGLGTFVEQLSPQPIAGRYESIAAGSAHSLVVNSDGVLSTFGSNDDGVLGTATVPANPQPTPLLLD